MSSFFKKPSWAKTGSNGPSTEFYRRSNQVYSDILAAESEEGEDYQEDTPDAKEVKQRRRDHESREQQKRRRISGSESSLVETLDDRPRSQSTENDRQSTGSRVIRGSSSQHMPADHPIRSPSLNARSQGNSQMPSKKTPIPSDIVDLESTPSSPELSVVANGKASGSKAELESSDLGSDEEFPELAQKARERARSRFSTQPDLPRTGGGSQSCNQTITASHTSSATASHNNKPAKDAIVRIFITSEIENTKSLIVHRKLSQDLRDVRKAWCHRQGFDDDMTASVFLTWRGKRLFDVTTCKRLGIQPEIENSFSFAADEDSGEEEFIRVHMEAVTEEIFEARKRLARMVPYGETEEEVPPAVNEAPSEVSLRITLKSPGLEDFKVKVRQKTLISTIVSNFREARKLPPDRDIHLYFDGERLEAESSVQGNDIADLDAIDVRVK